MLPSPNLIILSFTVRLVAWVVTTLPVTVKLPNNEVFPATVKLSPIFTSDVEWPILTTDPESWAPTFKEPVVCILPFVPSKNKFISELSPIVRFLLSGNTNEPAFNLPKASTTVSETVALPVNLRISALYVPKVLWSEEKVVIPLSVDIWTASPFSPLLSLTKLILAEPSDVLVDLIVRFGAKFSIFILPVTFTVLSNVNPVLDPVLIWPSVKVISAILESAAAAIVPVIFIASLVVTSPSNTTGPLNTDAPATLNLSSNIAEPLDTLSAAELVIVILLAARGAPSTWNVEAVWVTTLVWSEAILEPLNK